MELVKCFRISQNKSLEIQFNWRRWAIGKFSHWLTLNIDIRSSCDHAGASFGFGLLKLFYFGVEFYDNRHFDYDEED